MEGLLGAERRRDQRFRLERPLRYRATADMSNEASFRVGSTVDISRRGLRIVADRQMDLGSAVEVFVFAVAGALPLVSIVKVVRCTFRPYVEESFNEYYNPEMFVEYDVGLCLPGSTLFERIIDII